MKITATSLAILLLLTFSSQKEDQANKSKEVDNQFSGNCTVKINEYDPVLMWNDITYKKMNVLDTNGLERGQKLGEVSFRVNGNVCFGYKLKNGDATWSEKGTSIYQVKGYSEKFRLYVGEELYQVTENPKAKKVGDLYDIVGKVKKISLEYPVENSVSVEFTENDINEFIQGYTAIDYVPFEQLYKDSMFKSDKYFLRIQLNDNTNFVISYWPDENVFNHGYGSEKIKNLLLSYSKKLKALAPRPIE